MTVYNYTQIQDLTGDTSVEGKVLIEDLFSGDDPVIVYESEIAETLSPKAEGVPEGYEELHNQLQEAWNKRNGKADDIAIALGIRVDYLDPNHYEEEED